MADWLPEDHLAWFMLDAVEEMDLSAFNAELPKNYVAPAKKDIFR